MDFVSAEPDGLANLGLVVYTIPIVLVGMSGLFGDFPYMPGDYYVAHGLYFWPSCMFLAFTISILIRAMRRTLPTRTSTDPANNRINAVHQQPRHLSDKERV